MPPTTEVIVTKAQNERNAILGTGATRGQGGEYMWAQASLQGIVNKASSKKLLMFWTSFPFNVEYNLNNLGIYSGVTLTGLM